VPSRVRERLLRLKAKALSGRAGHPVLASTYLSPRTRQICREEGVGYVDLAGNGWLRLDDFYFEKVVDKNPFPPRGRPASLFAPVSSRIVRAMLEEPGRSWRVLELARATGVSLGQASNVTRRLVADAYAVRELRRLRLRDPGALLDAWRAEPFGREGQASPDLADPDRARHRFSSTIADEKRWAAYSFESDPQRLLAAIARLAEARGWRYAVTTFAAADRVAPFVHGIGAVEWYVEDETAAEAWREALDLRPVETGPNAILRVPRDAGVFYRARPVEGVTVVGDVQLYLDLWQEPGRGREQADFLRAQRLKF
jgi:hypothetical protein